MRTFARLLCVAFVTTAAVGVVGCKKPEAAAGTGPDAATMENAKNMMGQQYQKNAETMAAKKGSAGGGTGSGQAAGK